MKKQVRRAIEIKNYALRVDFTEEEAMQLISLLRYISLSPWHDYKTFAINFLRELGEDA